MADKMKKILSSTPFLHRKPAQRPRKPTKPLMTVLLTGSTGSLGNYLLDALLASSKVEKVICLNRSSDARTRQEASHTSRGLSTNFPNEKVEFLQCDLAAPYFGLTWSTHRRLAAEATHVLHNAWPVDFNRHVSSFEPQIRGVRQLIDFSCRCTYDVSLFFVSSMSVAARWGSVAGARGKVPEIILEDWRVADMGYGQSKLVSERLLAEASEVSGINVAVCRVGQVAGPVTRGQQGAWSKQEWLPSLIKSSKYLKMIPESLGPLENIDWVPVDLLAQILVELLPLQATGSPQQEAEGRANKAVVYHVVNPNAVGWNSLLPTITQNMSSDMAVVSFVDWVNRLRRSATDEQQQNLSDNPATKLLSFFDNLQDKAIRFPMARSTALDVTQTVRCSPTLAGLGKVNPEWMQLWMQQWGIYDARARSRHSVKMILDHGKAPNKWEQVSFRIARKKVPERNR